MGSKPKDLTGLKIGILTFVRLVEVRNRNAYWLVKCDCGGEKVVKACHVKSGLTTSCGCLQKANNIKLGKKLGKNIRTMPRSPRGHVIARGGNVEDYEISREIDAVLDLKPKRWKLKKVMATVPCPHCGNQDKDTITILRAKYYYCDECGEYFDRWKYEGY